MSSKQDKTMRHLGPYLLESSPVKAKVYQGIANSDFQKMSGVKLPPKPKKLGEGKFGAAYDIGGGKIMKITTDKNEAFASSLVAGKNVMGVWKVDSVWNYKPEKDVFVIIGEKLEMKEKKAWDAIELLGDAFEMNSEEEGIKAHIAKQQAYSSFYYKDKDLAGIMIGLGGDKAAMDLAFGMNALINMGIIFNDLHPGNVAWKGNKPKIIDLGQSQSGYGKIRVFECKH